MLEVALLFLIGKGVFELCKYVRRSYEDDVSKLMYISKDGLTYIDSRGRMRLTSNNHIVVHATQNGHHVLKDLKTFQIIRDYTQERKTIEYNRSKNKALAENKSIFCIDFDMHKTDKLKGMRYQDINTGEIYVIRQIGKYRIPFYMNMKGELVCIVDENWRYHQMVSKDIQIDIIQEIKKHYEYYKDKPLWNTTLNHLWSDVLDLQFCGKDFNKDEI